MKILPFNRHKAVEYAKKWAFSRNPKYYNFDKLGGDCTNFVSQCLFEGSGVMNLTKTFGWYYLSLNNRAPAWTGVNELYKFLTTNLGVGVFAKQVFATNSLQIGDVVQLSKNDRYYHTLIVSNIENGNIYVASHTYDAFNKPLYNYNFTTARFLHVLGYRE